MREAMIIVPQFDNDHAPLKHVRAVVAKRLMAAFGGCTIRTAHGSWLDSKGHAVIEPVWEIVAACEDTPANVHALRATAIDAGHMGKQEAVYCRFPSGDVEIIDTSPKPLSIAA
jgi:hypothetical protein